MRLILSMVSGVAATVVILSSLVSSGWLDASVVFYG